MELRSFVAGGVAGAAIAYAFDPQQGKGRRRRARDMLVARVRRLEHRGEQKAKYLRGKADGLLHTVTHARDEAEQVDDRTLVDRVRSEIFRGRGVSAGSVDLDAVDGVVTLRGQVDSRDVADQLESAARRVPGVLHVVSYLHDPTGEPANKRAAREASRTTPGT